MSVTFPSWSLYEDAIPVGDEALETLIQDELLSHNAFRSSREDRHQLNCPIHNTVFQLSSV